MNDRRQYGQASEQPITVVEIEAYARIFHLIEDVQFFYRVVAALDRAFIQHQMKKREQEKPKGGKGVTTPRPPPRRRR